MTGRYKAQAFRGIRIGHDEDQYEKYIKSLMKPDRANPQGMSRETAENFAAIYRHHFRKYRWEPL